MHAKHNGQKFAEHLYEMERILSLVMIKDWIPRVTDLQIRNISSVSYTHLDVYKRQVQGVELSFLTEQQQEWVQVVLEETGVIISTAQASKLKEHGKSDELTLPMVRLILTESKPIERKVTIKADKISRYFPEYYSNEQIENVIYQLLDEWNSSNSEK